MRTPVAMILEGGVLFFKDGTEVSNVSVEMIRALPELLAALEPLLDWCREHTSPIQPNSPHELLVAAHHAIAKAKGKSSE